MAEMKQCEECGAEGLDLECSCAYEDAQPIVETQYIRSYRWVQLAATVHRNFDANGTPCAEDAPANEGKAVVEVILRKPIDHITIKGEIK